MGTKGVPGLGFCSFWTGSHGYELQRIVPAPSSASELKLCNGWQETATNGWAVSV